MDLEKGAERIVNQCLDIGSDESVVIVDDGNDPDIIEALRSVTERKAGSLEYREYPEPDTSGTEPPEDVAEAMKSSDVFIAPTVKSISHTQARVDANKAGARGATLPGVNKEIWTGSLQADYSRIEEISQKAFSFLEEGQKIRIETPSGTDLEFKVRMDSFFTDTGIIHEPGDFGNLPAGEVHGGVIEMNGTLVIDHFPHADSGTEVVIENSQVVEVKGESKLKDAMEDECVRNIAEFGFGTNPEATLIGKTLQDEKVLGTVHIAFGDNTHYFPEDHERYNPCSVHWDAVCESPTVWLGEEKMLDRGKPVFLEK
ncbi:aminopeptidase [Candidatus Nanohaloarchaea archaeon]|nr:aminopeptidase [Candidatus Nanohaloarchaea archaeon]